MIAIPVIGDFLMNDKAYGMVKHVGVLVGPDVVLQNTPKKGEHICSLKEFTSDGHVTVMPSGADHMGVLERTRKILASPRKYNAVLRNCEHTAYEVTSGSARSPQIEKAARYVAKTLFSVVLARFGKKGFRAFR